MKNRTGLARRFIKFFLMCFLIGINYNTSFGQSFFFDNYSVKEGLAQSNVYDIIQDSKGYLWLGTSVGASSFDGIHFKNYTYEEGLANDGVQRIVEDKFGNIWFGHKGGAISRLKNDSIQFFRADSISADIISLITDKEGNIWAGSYGMGAIKIKNPNAESLENLDFIQYKGGKDQLNEIVFSINELQDGTLLFIIPYGLRYYDQREKVFKDYSREKLPHFYQFTCIFEDNSGDLWFGTDIGGLFKLAKDGTIYSYSMKNGLAGNFISTINQDKENTIWVGTWGNGISLISQNKILNFNATNGLPDLKIRCIKPDLEGNILIGTNENGLAIFKSKRFISYGEKDGIKGQQVNAILEDSKNRFWFGTDNGLSVFGRSGISLTNPFYLNQENGKIPENQIRFIKEDKSGNIWIASEHAVLSWSDNTGIIDYNFLINGYITQNNIVTSIQIDLQNNLWIGTINGLIVYEINADKVSFLKSTDGLAGNDISALFADSKGLVWIGCNQKGLTVYNDRDSTFTILKAGLGFSPTCITESIDKKIWVGTQARGLLVFDELNLLKQFRMKDGLYSDFISSLVSAINGDIFIGTSRGLNIYKHKDDRFLSFSGKSGFVGVEVKRNACIADIDGNIWFGTVKGATRIDIASDKENLTEPPVLINRVRVNMEDRKLGTYYSLSFKENSIIIDYIGICITDPESVVYKIMLEGAEQNWQPETNQTTASFSNLAPGDYTFKVMAKNSSGVWSKQAVNLSFTINPPFYQTKWFIISLIMFAAILIYVFIKVRERSLIMEKRILAEKVAERTIEISLKNKELELKNKNITDSIKYAKRIQDAMLPDTLYLRDILVNYFILYKPRDIISGDYYWATRKNEWIIFAAVDCTGHGVPGAFMSMLGITLLDEIINKKNILEANLILDQLREAVIKSLKQKGARGEAQDGMDVGLCSINTKTWEMQFAGAYNSFYLARNGEIVKYKADRMPIGIYFKKTNNFSRHNIQLQENDMIYLFTDGYVDQFGQDSGDKFMNKNFKNLLLEIHQRPLDKQKKILEERLDQWQGNIDQVDDILVLGIKINKDNYKIQNG
jgi:ligand-binding sensor domain-containing protein/serine phosphatase RsbU (regulator of sigma subunit)